MRGMVGRTGAHRCFLKEKEGQDTVDAPHPLLCCAQLLVDCNSCVQPRAQPSEQPADHPNGNASEPDTLSPLASHPVAIGGAASFRHCDHARHWRTILYALINMLETEYY